MNKEIRRGKVCWNCKHSVFYKRTGSNYGRGRGWCVHGLDIDTTWRPPDRFRQTLPVMKYFPETFEEFKEKLAGEYYGKRYAVDLAIKGNLHGDWEVIRQSYEKMRLLYQQWQQVDEVSWQDVCNLYTER